MLRLSPELDFKIRAFGTTVEVLDTVNALATFNVLCEEGREVVGALLTVDPLSEEFEKTLTLPVDKWQMPLLSESGDAPPNSQERAPTANPFPPLPELGKWGSGRSNR